MEEIIETTEKATEAIVEETVGKGNIGRKICKAGGIVGIVLACGAGAYFYIKHRKAKKQPTQTDENQNEVDESAEDETETTEDSED